MLGFLIGLVLGLVFAVLGAGGGIIAVPVLLVLFQLPTNEAAGAGLAIVFAAALTSALGALRAKRVDWRTVLFVGPVSMLGAMGGAKLNALVPERVTAALFALVLVVATVSLFRKKRDVSGGHASRTVLVLSGLGLGGLTGFLGVGGGFLLVPALVGLGKLPLSRAVGTSAALITLSSFAGGVTVMATRPDLVMLVLPLAGGAIVGAVLGTPLTGRLPEKALRVGFASLAVLVAVGMMGKAVLP